MRLRRAVAGLVLAFGLAVALATCAGAPRSKPAPKPRLVVLIVVDQLSTWAFERDRALYRGGFARLLRDGGYVRDGELPYAGSFTAPGHASIATGAPPSVHGVLGNSWYRRDEATERAAEYDPVAPAFPIGPSHGGELTDEGASSARALRVEGLADALRRATHDRARSVAISLKPRGAVFVAGRRPELAIWYESAAGGMTTTRAYAREVPRWLAETARAHPASRFFDQTWQPLDPDLLSRATGIADAAPGEGAAHGFTTTFPHALSASPNPSHAVSYTPFADELVLDTVLAAIPAMDLGADAIPDLLAISFSAHDFAGHLWGPGSWEVLDLKLRLDAALGRLFDALDARLGRDRWAAVLTSDHGITPVVEQSKVAGARRIRTDEIRAAIDAAVEPRLGKGPWVTLIGSDNIYLAPALAQAPPAARDEALAAAVLAVARIPGIAAAGRIDQIAGHCGDRAPLLRAICLSIVPGASGELYVVPLAGSLITDYRSGTHHDAPFADNRRVPILVLAPGLAPQQGPGSLLQVAPTVAALLGVPPPEAATERPLFGLSAR